MREWPPITDAELLQRLGLDRDLFVAAMEKFWKLAPPREYERPAFDHALGYPWRRPGCS